MSISISSSAFREGDTIPVKYTCDGAGVSPPLAWQGVPDEAESLVLICEDPDAPRGIFSHWVVYNLPPQDGELPEGFPAVRVMEDGTMQGISDAGKMGYSGPCPGKGTHRYVFTVYALDTELPLEPGAGRGQVLRAMEGHILDQDQITVRYGRT